MSKKDKNTENLFSAIGDIDERLLEEAATYKKESKKVGLFAILFGKNKANYANGSKRLAYVRAVAACLALIMFLAVGFTALNKIRLSENIDITLNDGNLSGGSNLSPDNGSVNDNPLDKGDIIGGNTGENDDGVLTESSVPDFSPSADIESVGPEDETEKPSASDFIKTEVNNVSTFSADVDTASYTYFRMLVNRGYSIDNIKHRAKTFRIEEFVNYFRFVVDMPNEDQLFGVRRELAPCPWNSESYLLRLTLQAEAAINNTKNNLVFLIDVSGSMSGSDKLDLLQQAFRYLVDNLDADDTVSIVTYSGKEAVVLDGCNGLDSESIMNAINSLEANGSTNGEAGLRTAYQLAEKHFKSDGNNRIIMASDGDLNVGISSKDELVEFISEKKDMGVYLSVLGFGFANYRDANMEALADNGNGVYYYIDGLSEAKKVFGTDLLGTLYTVAEDVKLQLEFNPETVDSYKLIGYENRVLANEDFENDKKDAGEVGASHQVTVCYEIKLKQSANIDDMYATLNVRYKNPGEPISLLDSYQIGYEEFSESMSQDMKFISAVVETVMLLKGSENLGDITVEDIIADLENIDLERFPERAEFLDILKKATK